MRGIYRNKKIAFFDKSIRNLKREKKHIVLLLKN